MLINGVILQPQIQIMEYNRIVAVTGLPGLYEALSSKSDGAIVRSLEDKSTRFISSRIHNLSHLESIEIYTTRENVTLADVFAAMKEKGDALPDGRDNKAVTDYFKQVYPELDFDRVYASDMKKMIRWYEILEKNEVDFTAKPEEEATEEAEAAEATEAGGDEEVKKPRAAKKKTEKAEKPAEEKPKKPRKKKEQE